MMDWWTFLQLLLMSLFTYVLVALAYALMNPLIVLGGIPVLIIALLIFVYFFYGKDEPTPQEEAQPAYVRDAENIATRAWTEYDEAEREEMEEEA